MPRRLRVFVNDESPNTLLKMGMPRKPRAQIKFLLEHILQLRHSPGTPDRRQRDGHRSGGECQQFVGGAGRGGGEWPASIHERKRASLDGGGDSVNKRAISAGPREPARSASTCNSADSRSRGTNTSAKPA